MAGMADFLRKLGNVERLLAGYSRLPGYFDTHPGTVERVATAAGRAQSISWQLDPTLAHGRARYLKQIDGLVLDTNPSEGLFRGTSFLHPDLGIHLRFPEGWRLVNSHRAVGALSPDGAARIFLMAEGRARDPRKAAEEFMAEHAEEYGVQVIQGQPVTIGEVDAYRVALRAQVGPYPMAGEMTFIPYRGLLYRVTFASAASRAAKHLSRSRNTARSFRPLTEAERRSIQVVRLRVVEAGPGEDLTALGRRTDNAFDPLRTAVLNGVFADATFAEGELVKIARSEPYGPARMAEP
jgi:predicted Zn-dependent protease